MKPWREAATLILAARTSAARSSAAGVHLNGKQATKSDTRVHNSNKNEDYQVLFLKRSPSSKFMPSRLVFPGGVTHPVDWSADWPQLFEYVHRGRYGEIMSPVEGGAITGKPPMIRAGYGRADEISGSNAGVSADVAFRICAIRETFEECGVLLCIDRSQIDQANNDKNAGTGGTPWHWTGNSHIINSSSNRITPESLERWRSEILSSPVRFLDMCSTLGLVPNVHALVQWRNWLTPVVEERLRARPRPPGADDASVRGQTVGSEVKNSKVGGKIPRRFDTMFYMCCLDCDTLPETSADKAETTTAEWYYPTELLSLIRPGMETHVGGKEPPKPHHLAPPQVYELTMLQRYKDLDTLCNQAWSQHDRDILSTCWMPDFRSSGDGIITLLPGDYMYPENIDYEGVRDNGENGTEFKPPQVENLRDENTHSLNRIVYTDQSFQNGTVLCNVI